MDSHFPECCLPLCSLLFIYLSCLCVCVWLNRVPWHAESWLSMDNGEVSDEKPILDSLLVLISVHQKGFAVPVHVCAEAKAFPDFLPQCSQSIMKEHPQSRCRFPSSDPVLKTYEGCFVKPTQRLQCNQNSSCVVTRIITLSLLHLTL